jgi:hypothetical protein
LARQAFQYLIDRIDRSSRDAFKKWELDGASMTPDQAFKEDLLRDGASQVTANLMYAAVSTHGPSPAGDAVRPRVTVHYRGA